MSSQHSPSSSPKQVALGALGALGVVYGDIGTSPLYALRESVHVHGTLVDPHHGAHVTLSEAPILGILSVIVWSLILVVTVKYVGYVLRADNDGEGGILALLALALDTKRPIAKQPIVYFLGLFGAALLYGDGIITPAISVLSAI